ncbi:type IV toxin-antitoxin system AbiEi family antitoxin domain-containing protein [Pseudomonas sp. GW6]
MKKPINQDKSSADILLEVIQDMHAQEQIVTRETLAANAGLTDMTKTQIDDRLAYLENNGRIVRVQRGVYVPAEQHKPARHVSRSLLPDGTSVLEIGDQVLILSPREARMVGEAMAGAAQQFVAIEMGHQAAHANKELSMQLKEMRRQVARLSSLIEPVEA